MEKKHKVLLFGIAIGILAALCLDDPEKACNIAKILTKSKDDKKVLSEDSS